MLSDEIKQTPSDTSGDEAVIKKHDELSVTILGKDIPVLSTDTCISINNGRIQKIENIEHCTQLQTLSLISQQLSEISGLTNNTLLEELELYQNHIKKIANINHLIHLKMLDLSFNEIRVIENLSNLIDLETLYLSSNKITEINGLNSQIKLRVLELGSNRLRLIENIDHLHSLEELWLGKNKIGSMNLPPLHRLQKLSIQSNRLTQWDTALFSNCPNLVELYLSHNCLTTIPIEITSLKYLRTLDLAGNKIDSLESLVECHELEELWMNDTSIKGVHNLKYLDKLTHLETIYLERTPLQWELGPGYRQAVLTHVPWLKQLDAIMLSTTVIVTMNKKNGPTSVMKHR